MLTAWVRVIRWRRDAHPVNGQIYQEGMTMMAAKPHTTDGAFTVTRTLRLDAPPLAMNTVRDRLQAQDGVLEIQPVHNGKSLRVRYDASSIGVERIARVLDEAGAPLAHDRWSRLKQAWYRYTDSNIQATAKTSGGSCCSQPTDIYASRRHRH